MLLPALVIGYGSIGKRHADILNSMDNISNIIVLSSQLDLPYMTISSLEKIPSLDLNYIVIVNDFEDSHYLEYIVNVNDFNYDFHHI